MSFVVGVSLLHVDSIGLYCALLHQEVKLDS